MAFEVTLPIMMNFSDVTIEQKCIASLRKAVDKYRLNMSVKFTPLFTYLRIPYGASHILPYDQSWSTEVHSIDCTYSPLYL